MEFNEGAAAECLSLCLIRYRPAITGKRPAKTDPSDLQLMLVKADGRRVVRLAEVRRPCYRNSVWQNRVSSTAPSARSSRLSGTAAVVRASSRLQAPPRFEGSGGRSSLIARLASA